MTLFDNNLVGVALGVSQVQVVVIGIEKSLILCSHVFCVRDPNEAGGTIHADEDE